MNRIRGMALCLLLSSCSIAYAQCPSGIPSAGNPLCLPPGAPGSPYGGNSSPPPPAVGPKARWRLTWGAFASDAAKAVVGTSTGQFSERAARRKAMDKCASMGGGELCSHADIRAPVCRDCRSSRRWVLSEIWNRDGWSDHPSCLGACTSAVL